VGDDRSGPAEFVDRHARARAYESVKALLSDDHCHERGVAAAHGVTSVALAESGAAGLADMTVELALKLASALERIATDHGLIAADLAEIWFAE
jgi:hypothetical protein